MSRIELPALNNRGLSIAGASPPDHRKRKRVCREAQTDSKANNKLFEEGTCVGFFVKITEISGEQPGVFVERGN